MGDVGVNENRLVYFLTVEFQPFLSINRVYFKIKRLETNTILEKSLIPVCTN